MAFETFLQQGKLAPRRGRRITYAVSVVLHAAAVMGAVAYSFWHVEELSPSTVTVTFISAAAAPPPPPPPPPLGGGAPAPKHKPVVRPKAEVAPKVTDVVQPQVEPVKEPPQEVPQAATKEEANVANAENAAGIGTPEGSKGGVVEGVKGGQVGGAVDGMGTSPAPVATKFLPPQTGALQKISGAEPDFPARLRRAGVNYLVIVKIVVGVSGAVQSVTLQKRADPTLDDIVVATVKTWRFRPLMANGTPVPFSYFGRFEFKSE